MSRTLFFGAMCALSTTPTCDAGIIVIGHRGACGYESENTLKSFAKAVDLNIPMIELDVHISKDGELVVIHDETVDRTTNGKGRVRDFTYAELQQLDAGNGACIPTLRQVIEFIDKRAVINIELKASGTAQKVVECIHDFVQKGWQAHHFFASSFDFNELAYFKKICPEVSIAAIVYDVPHDIVAQLAAIPTRMVGISKHALTQQIVQELHAQGLQVFVYTVDDLNEFYYFKSINVDGVCSNFPDRIMR